MESKKLKDDLDEEQENEEDMPVAPYDYENADYSIFKSKKAASNSRKIREKFKAKVSKKRIFLFFMCLIIIILFRDQRNRLGQKSRVSNRYLGVENRELHG